MGAISERLTIQRFRELYADHPEEDTYPTRAVAVAGRSLVAGRPLRPFRRLHDELL